MDFCAAAIAIGKASGRCYGQRIVTDVSRVGVAGADGGVASRNVAADGARLSSHTFVCSNCEPCGGYAYRHCFSSLVSYLSLLIYFSTCGGGCFLFLLLSCRRFFF